MQKFVQMHQKATTGHLLPVLSSPLLCSDTSGSTQLPALSPTTPPLQLPKHQPSLPWLGLFHVVRGSPAPTAISSHHPLLSAPGPIPHSAFHSDGDSSSSFRGPHPCCPPFPLLLSWLLTVSSSSPGFYPELPVRTSQLTPTHCAPATVSPLPTPRGQPESAVQAELCCHGHGHHRYIHLWTYLSS